MSACNQCCADLSQPSASSAWSGSTADTRAGEELVTGPGDGVTLVPGTSVALLTLATVSGGRNPSKDKCIGLADNNGSVC